MYMSYKAVAALAFTSMFSISTLLSPAYAEEQEKALNFGIISTESQQNLKPQWEPFLKDMETKLGIKVNAFFAPDYAGIIQGCALTKWTSPGTATSPQWKRWIARTARSLPRPLRQMAPGLLERADRQQRQPDQQPQRHARQTQRADLW
jgi:hypothetical protein